MSAPFDAMLADLHPELFDVFGSDGLIARGAAPAVPVRIVVDQGVERVGEYGQSTGRVQTVDFLAAQYRPRQGDVVTALDGLGAPLWTKPVASIDADDGYVIKAVMHG